MKLEGKWLTFAGAIVSLMGLIVNALSEQIMDKKMQECVREEVALALEEEKKKQEE